MSFQSNGKISQGKSFLSIVFPIVILCFSPALLAQQGSSNFYSEAPIIVENGVRKSPQLTVHFDNKVFDLRGGGSTASLNDMNATYSNIVNYFTQLEQKYGMIKFRKQIPSAEWGDVERRNLRTGQLP